MTSHDHHDRIILRHNLHLPKRPGVAVPFTVFLAINVVALLLVLEAWR